MKKIDIKTSERNEIVDITSEVRSLVAKSSVENGICIVYCPHTTAGITINENADPSVKTDITNALTKIIPDMNFQHLEGNADSHIKSSLIGCSEKIIIENGKLQLGRWQGILFCEFDGARSRNVWIEIVES